MRFLRVTLILSTVCIFALAGCRDEDKITKSVVETPDREAIHLRVAMMEKGDLVWFFKLSGPEALVAEHGPTFDAFVKSVRFEEDKDPTWTDPKGWKKDPAAKDRFAGYRIETKSKELEIAVTRFPADKFKLLDNVHRWEKQVNLPPTEKEADLLPPVVTREKIEGQAVTWVSLHGRAVHVVSKPPDPLAMNKKKDLPGLGIRKPAGGGAGGPGGGGQIPFKFTVPEGWAKKPDPGQFAADAYFVGGEKIVVTLSAVGGDHDENVNRWRKQVGLDELPPAKLKDTIRKQAVAGIESTFVDVSGADGPPGRNHIIGVVIPMGDVMWFVKMTGPLGQAGKHKGELETFVKSFKLEKK